MYCRKRNKHKSLQFIIARIHPLRVTPVIQPHHNHNHHTNQIRRSRRTMSEQIDEGLGEYLPGTNCPNSAEPSAPPEPVHNGTEQEDQISLESHTITAETDIRTADDIKSPPPPYSAGDLPSYEEAIRWNQSKGDMETIHNTS
ncbi:hypothetical protein ILUMI_11053 [Ignelater luminosus]|uniref:Uncharacterized protein n=1 Tax=Ignelater luminosus TaxID=2038154 RepID=A0A8K0GEB4_IGNLU|nr:hypothetical protein ILUMI_11053 [Ignelater luminosus]